MMFKVSLFDEKDFSDQNMEDAKVMRALGYPALAGHTEKQIGFGETIRRQKIKKIEEICYVSGRPPSPITDKLKQIKQAKWWIDHRNWTVKQFIDFVENEK